MLFSSISFIYYFLPIVLIIYFIVPSKLKNLVLLLSSLFFYFYGEPNYLWILLFSCLINYFFARIIEKNRQTKLSKYLLIIDILINIGMLFYFKYTDFFIQNINNMFGSDMALLKIVMPIGISFFTFQTMSYVIDVYTGKVKADKNFLSFATYVCLFPQLVAGPIVRYITINEELKSRKHSFSDFAIGVKRFVIGLAKKVLIANVIGEMCKILISSGSPTVLSYWIEAIGFTLQIYFDFSGYSDMAIGLGSMFGFHFLENFNYPLIASSITDFWRRWHISLSSWLRDYVYFPLGGNRVSKLKWIRNIFIVWFLTGFWHGADWNFIIWGLYFAVLLLIEKILLGNFLKKHKIFSYCYTIFFVVISFVIFNAGGLNEILTHLKGMFLMSNIPLYNVESLYYLRSYIVVIVIAIIAATPLMKNIILKISNKKIVKNIVSILEPIYFVVLLLIVTSFLIDASFNPFLYFRF